jgi:hypothetical protein
MGSTQASTASKSLDGEKLPKEVLMVGFSYGG